jgi:uncharacterized protein
VTPLLVAAGAAVLAGSALQTATGVGFALVSAPLLFAALGPQEAIGTLLVLGAVVGMLIVGTERRRPRPLRRDAAILLAASVPGALIGVAVLRALDETLLQIGVSLGVILTLAARRMTTTGPRPAWSAPVAGLAAGALNTSTNTSGPPLMLHLMGRGDDPERVRDTITVVFLGLALVSVAALWATDTSGAVPDADVLAAMVPLVVLGSLAGRRGFARLAAGEGYERVLTVVLLVSVTSGLLVALI